MKDLILVGSGGCMRELLWQIKEYNQEAKAKEHYNLLGYIDVAEDLGMDVGIEYLGDDDYLLSLDRPVSVAICVGSPQKRMELHDKLKVNKFLSFPSIVLCTEGIAPDYSIGEGSIISKSAIISTNVNIGDFVFVNIGAICCHDSVLSDFVTLAPRATLSGNVFVGKGSYIGAGATSIQGINIGENVMVGAGATVVKDIEDNLTVVGVPAKPIVHK